MKKKEMLDRYAKLANNRDEVASASVRMLQKLATEKDLDNYELILIHSYIAELANEDAKLDQAEIANLLAVANSDAFELDTRTAARDRAILMLEL